MILGGYSDIAKQEPLHDYQRFAANWLLRRLYVARKRGAGLFLDPGLGKTRITLTVLDLLFDLGEIRRALVVAPLRPIYSVWGSESNKWGFPQKTIILHNQHTRAMSYNMPIELINYDGLNKIADIENRWDIIVLDESTYIKHWSTKRTKAVRKLIKTIPRRIILTGTPAANSLDDLHSQLFVVDNGDALGKNVTAFRARYCTQGGWKGHKWSVRPEVRDSIRDAIKDRVLRMQAEDFLDMPELLQHEVWVRMDKSASIQYGRLKRELYAQLSTGDIFAQNSASAYTKCRQFANGQVYTTKDDGDRETHVAHKQKISALLELHEELAGKPLLVFYPFKHDLQQILSTPPFKGCPVISGGMKPDAVEKILRGWNAGKHHAILCQWQAASHGLNMQGACNDVACFGVVDSLEVYEQAIRRVYRQGVKGNQVRIHRLLTEGTVDEVMLERLKGKHESQAEFLEALKKHAKEH